MEFIFFWENLCVCSQVSNKSILMGGHLFNFWSLYSIKIHFWTHFSGLPAGTKPRKFSLPLGKRRWRLIFLYLLLHPTWWSSFQIFMKTTRPQLRPCSAHDAVLLCLLTLGCVVTVVRTCISATSAGEQCVLLCRFALKLYSREWIFTSWFYFFNLFFVSPSSQVYQLWWKRPLSLQCLRFLQICPVWLHAVC